CRCCIIGRSLRGERVDTVSRRLFNQKLIRTFALAVLLDEAFAVNAAQSAVQPKMKKWLHDLAAACKDVKEQRLRPIEWQARIVELHSRIEPQDVMAFIDFDRLIKGMRYPENMAADREVILPVDKAALKEMRFGRRIFGLKKGAAIVPHAHNDLVSAHL